MYTLLLISWLLCLLFSHLWPFGPLAFFAPSIIWAFLFRPFSFFPTLIVSALWLDFSSFSTPIGFHLGVYLFSGYMLKYFFSSFSENSVSFALQLLFFSFFITLGEWLGLALLGQAPLFSFGWILTDLLLMPFFDMIYGIVMIFLPLYGLKKLLLQQRKERE